jgi:hypothetical protein
MQTRIARARRKHMAANDIRDVRPHKGYGEAVALNCALRMESDA